MSTVTATRAVRLIRAGRLPYAAAWELQRSIAAARSAGAAPDTLLLLEHPPTITLGNKADPANVLLPAEELARRGVDLVQSDRGGDVTYHAPGQIVGYPILKLGPLGLGAGDYVRRLEEVIIRTLADYGLAGERVPGLAGVWVGGGAAKVCAVGVKLSAGGISSHGFALNVCPDLTGFAQIVPCGIADRAVTSMAALLGRNLGAAAVSAALLGHFAEVFGVALGEGEHRRDAVQ
jgi:lipoyl(octanoyl) transferase